MKIREELIQYLYDTVNNENLCEDMQGKFIALEKICERNFPKDKEDDFMSAICNLEYAAFMAGANMVLDFISGREVQ
ncbi:MAG: hypothetical protein IJZ53_11065 [Tyzzerella sp.]|nr:hypothetical protein [Tyzzerella sp.]